MSGAVLTSSIRDHERLAEFRKLNSTCLIMTLNKDNSSEECERYTVTDEKASGAAHVEAFFSARSLRAAQLSLPYTSTSISILSSSASNSSSSGYAAKAFSLILADYFNFKDDGRDAWMSFMGEAIPFLLDQGHIDDSTRIIIPCLKRERNARQDFEERLHKKKIDFEVSGITAESNALVSATAAWAADTNSNHRGTVTQRMDQHALELAALDAEAPFVQFSKLKFKKE
jgi:hypothetical protein